MHYLRHRGMAQSLKFSSLFFILATISAITFLGLLIFYFVSKNEVSYSAFIAAPLLTALFSAFNLLAATKCRCQLCQAAMMLPLKCTKNKNARSLFGSYRLRLALRVLIKKSYRCPACGEHFSCMPPPPDHRGSSATQTHIDQTSPNHRMRKVSTIRRSSSAPSKRRP